MAPLVICHGHGMPCLAQMWSSGELHDRDQVSSILRSTPEADIQQTRMLLVSLPGLAGWG